MQAYVPSPPLQLQQPMTGITHWQTPVAVVPLTGYPSAYPHVVNVSDHDFAAPYLTPAMYQQRAYQPQMQPAAPVRRRATSGRQPAGSGAPENGQQPKREPNLVRYDDSILQAMGFKPKRPDWSRILPFTDESRERLGIAVPSISSQATPIAQSPAQQGATLNRDALYSAIEEYVPREYLEKPISVQPQTAPVPAAMDLNRDALYSAIEEYVPRDYLQNTTPSTASAPVVLPVPMAVSHPQRTVLDALMGGSFMPVQEVEETPVAIQPIPIIPAIGG